MIALWTNHIEIFPDACINMFKAREGAHTFLVTWCVCLMEQVAEH